MELGVNGAQAGPQVQAARRLGRADFPAFVAHIQTHDPGFVQPQNVGRIFAEIGVGQKEYAVALIQSPAQHDRRIGRGAYAAAMPSAQGFHRGGGIDVGQRDDPRAVRGQAAEHLFRQRGRGHFGHDAAGRGIRGVHLLPVQGQNGRCFGHEMHAAENDVLGFQPVDTPGQFQGIAQNVGVADDGIVLVVMGENAEPVSQSGPDTGEFVFHVRS